MECERRIMSDMGVARPKGIACVFFQEIREGDRRKLQARSNTSPSGGGARDLRVPHKEFGPMFRRMFPHDVAQERLRRGARERVPCYGGELYWVNESGEHSVKVQYEPPTDARPSEGRIARIHDLPVLADKVPSQRDGRCFLLLVQNDEGKVFPHYVTDAQLAAGDWNAIVTQAIAECTAGTPANRSVRGYVDFIGGAGYCHG